MTDLELKQHIKDVKSKIRITKVVATRAVKTKSGDFFAGFASEWDSVQDDGAQGMIQLEESNTSGMTLKEAKTAHLLLAMEANIAAHEAALISGAISGDHCTQATTNAKNRFVLLMKALNKEIVE